MHAGSCARPRRIGPAPQPSRRGCIARRAPTGWPKARAARSPRLPHSGRPGSAGSRGLRAGTPTMARVRARACTRRVRHWLRRARGAHRPTGRELRRGRRASDGEAQIGMRRRPRGFARPREASVRAPGSPHHREAPAGWLLVATPRLRRCVRAPWPAWPPQRQLRRSVVPAAHQVRLGGLAQPACSGERAAVLLRHSTEHRGRARSARTGLGGGVNDDRIATNSEQLPDAAGPQARREGYRRGVRHVVAGGPRLAGIRRSATPPPSDSSLTD
eukprot:scaffold48029_cov69-Phaeocystis_antarctica.AAC.5